ncbi:ribosome biogenesis GTPase Der [Pelagicoccus sp. SDUM812003]|uniref:ribosome biogenesis GTPase Der n=1 Tax=Pelagicoccus sp. SDUM812003 TaxID=3041267 RepID=UPI0028108E53|nr:ribosome biogenesis GTPase Der [Pelagicoccus sp. SDUM812003]MDQ8202873.1 ribosome biogenesis GTPase Der [Pelagicoccus sp. SDUM812003]
MNFTVAIVGRPNVGKSRLFNRLAGKRISIVHDMPGVTRDIISRDLEDGYTLMDTGGMGLLEGMSDTPAKLVTAVEGQIDFSIDAADLILFVVDGREGLQALDAQMAEKLRRTQKRVLLVVNKVDTDTTAIRDKEFYRYGFGEPFLVSAEHGRGVSGLRKSVLKIRDEVVGPPAPETESGKKVIKVCFIGRPNVGKSSLSNCLVQSERFIVSDVPGTTRDSINMPFTWKSKRGEDWHFQLTDTAGIRKKTKLNSSVEYFSRVRSLDAIRDVDVVFMVVDAKEGPTNQDKAIAGEATAANKPVVIVVNKWDLTLKAWENDEIDGFETEKDFREAFEKGIRRELFFVPGSPVVFVSAKEGIDIEKILYHARQLDKRMGRKIPTGRLNNKIYKMAERMPAPKKDGRRFRVYYAVHTGNRPYRFKIFCNQAKKLADSYKRFMVAGLVEEFDLDGCPMVFDLVNKKNPYIQED